MSDRHLDSLETWEKALNRLGEALDRESSDRINKDASIQRFEFSFELGWKALKYCLQVEGREMQTPREVLKEAFRIRWIIDEGAWLQMLTDRNLSSHTYDESLADAVYSRLDQHLQQMHSLLLRLKSRFSSG